jgi:hypothetical protein
MLRLQIGAIKNWLLNIRDLCKIILSHKVANLIDKIYIEPKSQSYDHFSFSDYVVFFSTYILCTFMFFIVIVIFAIFFPGIIARFTILSYVIIHIIPM